MQKEQLHISISEVETMRNYLKNREGQLQEFLRTIVQIETPSSKADTQDAIFKILQKKFHDLDFYTLRMKGQNTGGYLYARPKNREKHQARQLLIGHCDTVWPVGTLKQMQIKSEHGKLSGPGVYDMKAGLTQIIFALQMIRDLKLAPDLTPIILINSDEEIGSRESGKIIKQLAKIAHRAFIAEPPLGLNGKIKTARKGLGRFTILITGKAAHAGLDPYGGASAIMELSHQVQQLFAMNDPEKGITINVGMIEGGISPNVVAPQSKAVIDVRVLSQIDAEAITRQIFALLPNNPETKIKIQGRMGRPPMEKTPENRKLWLLARTVGEQMGLELEEATAGGGSDGNTTSLYTATLDGLGTTGDGAHASHEFIFTNKLLERTLLLALLILSKAQ